MRELIVTVQPPKVQVLGGLPELETLSSKVVRVVVAAEGAVASSAVAEKGLEPAGPTVAEVGHDHVLAPRDAWAAGRGLEAAGPMLVGVGLGQVLEPMDLKELEVGFGPLASKVVGLAVGAETGAKHSFDPAAAGVEPQARVVEDVPGPGPMLVVEQLAEPMVVVPVALAELVAPMVAEVGNLSEAAVPRVALAFVAEADSKAAGQAVVEAALEAGAMAAGYLSEEGTSLEAGPMLLEHYSSEVGTALEAGSMLLEQYSSEVGTALVAGPMLAGLAEGTEEVPSHS